MFDALKSRYMTWFSASCRNDKPLAAPIATLSLTPQGKGSAPPKRAESFCWAWEKLKMLKKVAIEQKTYA